MLRYDVGGINNVRDFVSAADKVWKDPVVRLEAQAAGIDVTQLPESFGEAVTVTREGSGMEPGTTALVIAFAPVAAQIVRDLWATIILPRLEQKFSIKLIDGRKG